MSFSDCWVTPSYFGSVVVLLTHMVGRRESKIAQMYELTIATIKTHPHQTQSSGIITLAAPAVYIGNLVSQVINMTARCNWVLVVICKLASQIVEYLEAKAESISLKQTYVSTWIIKFAKKERKKVFCVKPRQIGIHLVIGEDGLSVWMLTSVEGNRSLPILRSHNFRTTCHRGNVMLIVDLKPDGNEAKRRFDFGCVLCSWWTKRWWGCVGSVEEAC